jgi:hypothetical protein
MRWRTFERLTSKHDQLVERSMQAIMQKLGGFRGYGHLFIRKWPTVCGADSLLTGKITGNFTKIGPFGEKLSAGTQQNQLVAGQFPTK